MLMRLCLCLCLCASENSIRQISGFVSLMFLLMLILMSRVFSLVMPMSKGGKFLKKLCAASVGVDKTKLSCYAYALVRASLKYHPQDVVACDENGNVSSHF